ncbi:hypothetical protein HK099_007616 [Clydaea vesicula]|uniref:Peptidyl-prolyl cis-trans isomerase n=1 Tax=Clydaea vesicula TaxID=447962 RepID=A0AAD5TWR7_9FUNG|nr:hypothetical protein HK099_007616 [Clydaea vesicula]KAJ3387652.1 hypothetical protein HDU92_001844 [Lobulomyces angularis]
MTVYLQISVGCQQDYKKKLSQYELGVNYFNTKRNQFGLNNKIINELTTEEQEFVIENYNNEHNNCNIILQKPESLVKGTFKFKLFENECPKTCLNFKSLATGESGVGKVSKKPLHYLNVPIHRIVKNFIAQGGDITRMDGSGGDSIYNGKFNDEKQGLKIKFKKGSIGMANKSKNSNTSQFFVVLTDEDAELKKLNGKYVCFGEVTNEEGLNLLDFLNTLGTDDGDVLNQQIIISDCGLI